MNPKHVKIKHTLIRQPDGSNCYSGPTCRRHHKYNEAYLAVQKVASNDKVVKTLDKLAIIIEDRICKNSLADYPTLDAMKDTHKVNAMFCEKHYVYHTFDAQDIQNDIRTWKNSWVSRLKQPALLGLIGIDGYKLLVSPVTGGYADSRSPYSHPFFVELKANSWKLGKIRKNYNKGLETELLVLTSKLSNEQLLDWYQCRRKQAYITKETAIKSNGTANSSKEPYLCSRCGNWHVGGGNGKTSVNTQLERAKRAWVSGEYRSRANAYAIDQGLA